MIAIVRVRLLVLSTIGIGLKVRRLWGGLYLKHCDNWSFVSDSRDISKTQPHSPSLLMFIPGKIPAHPIIVLGLMAIEWQISYLGRPFTPTL